MRVETVPTVSVNPASRFGAKKTVIFRLRLISANYLSPFRNIESENQAIPDADRGYCLNRAASVRAYPHGRNTRSLEGVVHMNLSRRIAVVIISVVIALPLGASQVVPMDRDGRFYALGVGKRPCSDPEAERACPVRNQAIKGGSCEEHLGELTAVGGAPAWPSPAARARHALERGTAADLGGTSWQLVKFQSSDDTTLTPDDKSKYTIAFGNDGRMSGRLDCNRGSDTWKSDGPNQLQFGPMALTRAMCPPGSLHDRIAKDWSAMRSYVIKDGHLFLSLMADGGTYEFEPIGR